ncbi:unnamed protein product [Rhodiola kirilowii]
MASDQVASVQATISWAFPCIIVSSTERVFDIGDLWMFSSCG